MSRLFTSSLLAVLLSSSFACGDDDDDMTGDGDADTDGDTDADGDTDGDTDADADADAGVDAGPEPVTLTGQVVGEYVDGVAPPIEGATVSLLDHAGESLADGLTDADGRFSLSALEADLGFLLVDPVPGYLGQLRAQESRGGLEFYPVVLMSETGTQQQYAYAGLDYDPARGTIAAGFNPVDHDLGGEGLELEPGPDHDPAFVLVEGGVIVSDVLPPVCPNVGPVPCTDIPRSDVIFVPNVEPTLVAIRLIDPAGGTCSLRFGPDQWPTLANVATAIDIDCVP